MIGCVDHLLHLLLQDAWATAQAAGEAAFYAIFNPKFPQDILTATWNGITAHKIAFRSVWTTDTKTDAAIVIATELLGEEDPNPMLGFSFRRQLAGTAVDQWNMQLQSRVGIYIYAPDKDIIRVLHVFCHAAIMSGLKWLSDNGVDDMSYGGARDLLPEERTRPDGGNGYCRTQHWLFRAAEELHRIGGPEGLTPRFITVHDHRTFVGARRDAETRTTIPLADNLPGGLDPEPST